MPLRSIGTDARGRTRFVRLRFDPRAYTIPSDYLDNVRKNYATYGSRELLAQYDGPFMGLQRVRELTRSGKRFVLLRQAGTAEWALEVELTDGNLGELRALSPQEAFELSRELDAAHDPPIELEK